MILRQGLDVTIGLYAAVIVVTIALLILAFFAYKRRYRTIKPEHFALKWRDMQKLCADQDTWNLAIIDADKLLEEALKKRRLSGKTEGERLTKAQRMLSDNESVWFGHKLRTKIEIAPETKLKKKDVKQALVGIRQALKDLGAFPDGK